MTLSGVKPHRYGTGVLLRVPAPPPSRHLRQEMDGERLPAGSDKVASGGGSSGLVVEALFILTHIARVSREIELAQGDPPMPQALLLLLLQLLLSPVIPYWHRHRLRVEPGSRRTVVLHSEAASAGLQ